MKRARMNDEPQIKVGNGRNAPAGPPGNKKAFQHGFYTYKPTLNGDGLEQLLRRTAKKGLSIGARGPR